MAGRARVKRIMKFNAVIKTRERPWALDSTSESSVALLDPQIEICYLIITRKTILDFEKSRHYNGSFL
jgi:hypothetical protein